MFDNTDVACAFFPLDCRARCTKKATDEHALGNVVTVILISFLPLTLMNRAKLVFAKRDPVSHPVYQLCHVSQNACRQRFIDPRSSKLVSIQACDLQEVEKTKIHDPDAHSKVINDVLCQNFHNLFSRARIIL